MAASPNADQTDFWNSLPARNWATFQKDLDALHGAVTDLLLAGARPGTGQTVLDLGCGAGGSTFAFARAVGEKGRVDGIDISLPLVERAKERRKALGVDNVTFAIADAQDHAFARGDYDLAVSRFGLMFFSDTVAAFANIATALRAEGRLVFAAWAGPEHNPWFTLPQQAAAARLGPVEPSPPCAPGPMAFRDTDRVLGILADAGLEDGAVHGADIELHHPGGLAAVMRVIPNVGPMARMLREKNGTNADRDAILETVRAEFAGYDADDGLRVPARVNVFTARAR